MNQRKLFSSMSVSAAILGIALCVPAAMQAQDTTPQQQSQQAPPPNSGMPMRPHHPPGPKRQLRHLTKVLNLTADQQQQMLPILRERDKQMRAIHENTSLTPQQQHQQMRTLMLDTRQKMEAVMTDSQKQQFEQMQQNMRGRRMRQNGPPPAGSSPDSGGQNSPQPQ